jgi:hypothetical protein
VAADQAAPDVGQVRAQGGGSDDLNPVGEAGQLPRHHELGLRPQLHLYASAPVRLA